MNEIKTDGTYQDTVEEMGDFPYLPPGPSKYKQSYIVVMESGQIVKWTGYGENETKGIDNAMAYASNKTGQKVWDLCNRPVKG